MTQAYARKKSELETPIRSQAYDLPIYRKIQKISPGLRFIFVQKAFLLGLFSRELIFGGAYFAFQNGLGFHLRKQPKTASTNSPWAYIRKDICV